MHPSSIYFVCVMFILSSISDAQTPLPVQWSVFESSTLDNRRTESWDVGMDEEGDIYWLVDATHSTAQGVDVHLYKLNQQGQYLWSNPLLIGGAGAQRGYRFLYHDNALLIGGKECDGFGQQTCDFRIWGYELSNLSSMFTYEDDLDNLYEECDGIMPLSTGYFTTGWTETDTSRLDIYLARLNEKGEKIWSRRWGSALGEHQDGHVAMIDSTVFLCGASGQPLPGYTNSLYNGRSLLAAFDAHTGELVDSTSWVTATPTNPYVENALGLASDGQYLYVTGVYSEGIGAWQLYIAKYTTQLDRVWFRDWGFPGVESARSLVVHPDKGVFIAGQSQWGEGGDQDLALLQINTDGEWLNAWRWGESLDDSPYSIYRYDNTLLISGEGNKTDALFPSSDAFVISISLDSLVTSNEHIDPSTGTPCNLAPNPVRSGTSLTWNSMESNRISFNGWINSNGQRIPVNQLNNIRLIVPNEPGIYWLDFKLDGTMQKCGPVIVH